MSHVRRSKELLAVRSDHLFLDPGWCRTPEAEVVNSVVVIIDRYELPLATDEEPGRSVARTFVDLRQSEAELAKPIDRVERRGHGTTLMRGSDVVRSRPSGTASLRRGRAPLQIPVRLDLSCRKSAAERDHAARCGSREPLAGESRRVV